MTSSANQSGIDSTPEETAREMLDFDCFDSYDDSDHQIGHQYLMSEFEPLIRDKIDEEVEENLDPNKSTPKMISLKKSLTRIRVAFDEKELTGAQNESTSEPKFSNISNALEEIELGIDNQYMIEMREMQEKRRLVMQQKEKRRKEMAEQRYLEATLNVKPEMTAANTGKRKRFSPYPSMASVLSYNRVNEHNSVVSIENLSAVTNEYSIRTLCQTIGPIFGCAIVLSGDGERKAVAHFQCSDDANEFRRKYHLFPLDSKRIRTKIV